MIIAPHQRSRGSAMLHTLRAMGHEVGDSQKGQATAVNDDRYGGGWMCHVPASHRHTQRLGPVDITSVIYIHHGNDPALVIDAVDDPVGSASRSEPVGKRREQPLADAIGIIQ